MKTIYRHKTGFQDGTKYLEVDGEKVTIVTVHGSKESTAYTPKMCECYVTRGLWVKEVIED